MPPDDGWRQLRRPAPQARHPSQPLEASPFSRLSVAHALAMGGDALVTMALAGSLFFDVSPDAARGKVALSLVLTMAPFAVVAPFLGPAIDTRQRGRRLMVVISAAGRAVLCLFMARWIDSLLLFPTAFGLLVLSKAHSVAKSALVPSAVATEDELVEANSKLAITGVLMGFVAAIPGVALLKFVGGAAVLRFAVLVFIAAAIAGGRVRELPHEEPPPPPPGEAERRGAGILLASVAMALLRASVGFLAFLVAFAFRRGDAPAWWFGVVLAASMGGNLVGAAVAPRLRDKVKEELILAVSLGAVGVAGCAAARFGGLLGAALLAPVLGVAAGAGKLAFDALVQRDSARSEHGRSFARLEAIFQLAWVAGALVPVAVTVGLHGGATGLGVVTLLAAVAYVVGRVVLSRRTEAGVRPPQPPVAPRSPGSPATATAAPARSPSVPASVGDVDAGQPEAGGVHLGGSG